MKRTGSERWCPEFSPVLYMVLVHLRELPVIDGKTGKTTEFGMIICSEFATKNCSVSKSSRCRADVNTVKVRPKMTTPEVRVRTELVRTARSLLWQLQGLSL